MPTMTKHAPQADPLADVEALVAEADRALDVARRAEATLATAGRALMAKVGAAARIARGDRRTRTSAQSHIERLLDYGGSVDLDKFERDLATRPHLFAAVGRALYHVQDLIIDGTWRAGHPLVEDQLRRAAADYSQDTDTALVAELSRAGYNAFHLVALAFRRAAAAHPELFGTMSWEAEDAEIKQINAMIETTATMMRASEPLLASLCDAYGVQRRPGVDPVPDLVDAAVAQAAR
jgi:hypothetical protein